jgi:general secretion pathway protein D
MKAIRIIVSGLVASLPLLAAAQEGMSSKMGGGVEITDIIARYAKRTGKAFVADGRVRAQVPLFGIDVDRLSEDQLLAILQTSGFALTNQGGILAVVPDAGARQFATSVHTDADFKALDHEYVTVVLQPKAVCAAHLVPILRPLMPQAAHLAAHPQTNTLILNDRAANARRIAQLTQQLDANARGEKKSCEPPTQKAE